MTPAGTASHAAWHKGQPSETRNRNPQLQIVWAEPA